jgi:ATP-dependent exoDNAse (exonuclease V) beta subunit
MQRQVDKVLIGRQLQNLGFRSERIDAASSTVVRALENTLSDERGRWTLADHTDARSEWALSVVGSVVESVVETTTPDTMQVQKVVIDRTFVDDAGFRWIVDYKTGDHGGGQVESFLDQEQKRYAEQLNRYARILRNIDDRPIKVGLYFPMLKGWREWQPAQSNGS